MRRGGEFIDEIKEWWFTKGWSVSVDIASGHENGSLGTSARLHDGNISFFTGTSRLVVGLIESTFNESLHMRGRESCEQRSVAGSN